MAKSIQLKRMDKYLLFHQTVRHALLNSNPVDYNGRPFIEMLCEEPFTDDFLLQMTWTSQTMSWYRTTWIKDQDRVIIDAWFEYLKEDDVLPIDLSLRKERGSENPKMIEPLVEEIRRLSIPLVFQNDLEGRDGNGITLKIGTDDSFVCLSWQSRKTPKEWGDWDKIFEKILLINAKLLVR